MRCTYCVSAVACVVLAGLLSSVPTVEARTNPAVHAFTELQFDTLRDVTLACSALSVVGTAFIVITYAVFPDIQTFPFKLIVYLSAANFFSSVAYFFDLQGDFRVDPSPGFQCYFGAGLAEYFDVASFLWTSVIGFNILQVLVLKRGRSVEQYEKWYHLFCWGVPLILLIIAIAGGALGDAGTWCWIKLGLDGYRFGLYYIPLFLVLIGNAVLYYIIMRGMRDSNLSDAVNFRLRLYLIVFVALRISSAANRLQESADPEHPQFWLYFIHSFASPLQGFANAMVYGFTVKVRQQYRRVLCPRRSHDVENPLRHVMTNHADGGGLPTAKSSGSANRL